MAGKYMRIKKVVIPILTLIILASQIAGCSIISSKEMINMINQGQSITIELPAPSYEINIKGQLEEDKAWVQLDQLQTHNKGFRQDFDSLFNINITSQNSINGKNGCLFVDEVGDRNGNTTLEDALRNKVFNTKYWSDTTVKNKLAALVEQAYTDVDRNSEFAIIGSLNAYYGLLDDYLNPDSFNGTQSLTREQFYTLVFKSEEGVRPIEIDTVFEQAIGGQTEKSKYAQEVDEYGFLSVENKSLDENSYKGNISRAEAVYMMVNKHLAEELAKVTGKEQAFADTKNGGDVALKLGFKYKDKDTKEVVSKDRWQAYILAVSVQHPDKGLQEELYKAMVVAKNLGLITGSESRWDEPISKAEAIQLVVNTHLAKNSLYGYLSEVEYGKMNINKFGIATGDMYAPDGPPIPHEVPVIDWEEPPVPTVYNKDADINADGHVDKTEWEKWVTENPADSNKDLHITEQEQAEFNKPVPPASNNGNKGGSDTKPSGNTTKPTTGTNTPDPKPVNPPTKENKKSGIATDEELDNWGNDTPMTQEEIDRFNENASKPFDPIN